MEVLAEVASEAEVPEEDGKKIAGSKQSRRAIGHKYTNSSTVLRKLLTTHYLLLTIQIMQTTKLEKIKSTLGDHLLSILRYQRYKTEIVVFVVTNVDYQVLDSLRKDFQGENFIIFKEDEIVNGKDVFPLEFLHIKNNHLLVEGHDYFTNLKISKKHLKIKLEFELRNKLIYLREQFLLAKKRRNLLKIIIPSLAIIFEGLNFLKDQENQGIEKDIQNIGKNYSVDLAVLSDLIEAEKNGYNLTGEKKNQLIQDLNDNLVILSQKVDKI